MQQVVEVIGDDPERVRQLSGRRRVHAGELRGDQRRRPDGDGRVVAGMVERRGGRFHDDLQVRRIDGDRYIDGGTSPQLIGDPATDGIVTAGEMPGVVGVQALMAGRVPPTPPAGGGPPPTCSSRRRVPPAGVGQGNGIHFSRPAALRRRPPDGPRPALAAPDRQYHVGMGVPSSRRGALRMTTAHLLRPGPRPRTRRRLEAEQLSDRRSIDLVADHRPKYR